MDPVTENAEHIPELDDLVRDGTTSYAWDPDDSEPWSPQPSRAVRVLRRALPHQGR